MIRRSLAFLQIILLVSVSFTIAFVLSEQVGLASAAGEAFAPGWWNSQAAPGSGLSFSGGASTPPPITTGGPAALPASVAAPSTVTPPATVGLTADPIGFLYGGKGFAGAGGALFSGLVWAGTIGFAAYFVGKMFGMTPNNAKALGFAGATTAGVWSTLYLAGQNGVLAQQSFLVQWAPIIGIGLGVAVFLAMYKKEKIEIISFECYPWEPPLGGTNCEKCNTDPTRPCSEYRCKSLGQACALVNQGGNELCVNTGKGDVAAPTIIPTQDSLRPLGLIFSPDNTISPPNKGVRIHPTKGENGCLQPFTQLEFGFNTTEPAQCRVDWNLVPKYDDLAFLFGETNEYAYAHLQKMRVPAPESSEDGSGANDGSAPVIGKDGTFTLWVRCRDAMGNFNPGAFAFRFCVNKGPDVNPPVIEGTSIADNAPVQFNADKVGIEVYVDKPSECKWSTTDKTFDLMENSLSCPSQTYQINANRQYVCSGELRGIVNRQDNPFFFRCKSYPGKKESDRFVMSQSKKLTLKGTQELVILSSGPNGTIQGSTESVPVTLQVATAFGAEEGRATCTFSDIKAEVDRTPMEFTQDIVHNQTLLLSEGAHQYFFRCVDAGGNSVEANTTFTVLIDRQKPLVARVLRDGDNLKVVTTEEASCVYSTTSCTYNFEDGLPLGYEDATKKDVHVTTWAVDKTFYIKCQDTSGNRPAPNACSAVARGSEL